MPHKAEQSESLGEYSPDRLTEMAIEPVEGDNQFQLEGVKRLLEMAWDGDGKAFDGLVMAAVLQPDPSIYKEVVDALRDVAATARSPELQGIAHHSVYRISRER